MKLKDKVSVVTGAGSGLGKAIALRFAQEGSRIVVAEINEATAQETLKLVHAKGVEAFSVCTDVGDSGSVANLFKSLDDRGWPVDILVNNAGNADHRNLAVYQNDIFSILSLQAWNIWWLVQTAAVGASYTTDHVAVLGPITFRHIGFLITGLLSLVVAVLILRDPRPRTFILGLAASTLIWYGFLTQMHERYAYGALIFLLLLIPERRIAWLYLAFSVVFTLDLLSAAPPAPVFAEWLPFGSVVSIIGSFVMIAITFLVLTWMASPRQEEAVGPDHRVAVDGEPASV